jgi:putative component of toxin-antitoxin plasmid stabilization module
MSAARRPPRDAASAGAEAARRPAPAVERKPLDPMQFITAIGSPVALATALLFYFGWVRSEWQAKEFGADASVFAMSTQDFVLRSVNVLFFPVILLMLAGLLALRLDRTLRPATASRPWIGPLGRLLQFSWVVFLPLGFGLLAVDRDVGDVLLPMCVVLSILGPAYGTVLRRHATGDRTPSSRTVVALLIALLTVSLFWQTERFARVAGKAFAQDIKDNLSDQLDRVEVFSARDLHIAGTGVTETRLTGDDVAYGYRYSGLYLLQRSGNKYFLLTGGWDQDQGRLIVVPDSDTIRLEFGP